MVDLQAVPFTPDTIPLHMVAGGRQERALVKYLIEHYQHYPHELDLVANLHLLALLEFFMLYNLTPEQIGIDYDVLAKFLSLAERPDKVLKHFDMEKLAKHLDVEKIAKHLDMEKIAKHLDMEKVVKHVDTDMLLDGLMKHLGPEKYQEFVDRHKQPLPAEPGVAVDPPSVGHGGAC